MVELRTLGALRLTASDGREIQSVLAQPKRLALLVYLAAARPRGFHRRETLVGVFWPELDQEHARAALRKAIHHLRRSLGAGIVIGHGDEEVGIDPGLLWCDAVAMEAAAERGDATTTLELYAGDLAPGLFATEAPEFERWLSLERERLREVASAAAWVLAEEEERAGSAVAAVRAAERAVALEPLGEGAHRRLILILQRCGDRAGALRHHAAFRERLRLELEVEPSAETEALIARVRAQDAAPAPEPPFTGADRPTPPITPAPEGPAAQAPSPPAAATPTPAHRRRPRAARSAAGVLTAVAALALVAGLLSALKPAAGTDPAGDADLVAVLPFRTSGADPGLAYLREGMLDLLAAILTGEGGPRAADPRRVMAAWDAAVPASGGDLPSGAAHEIAAAVGAGLLLWGEVVGTPEHLVLTAALVEVGGGRERARATASGPADSLTMLVDRLAAALMSLDAGEREHRLAALTGTPLPALRSYLEGQAAYRAGHYEAALGGFGRALELDSTFALAALGLARAAGWVGGTEHARGRGPALAWAARDRLSARDRAAFQARYGPRYPGTSPAVEHLAAIEEALRGSPDAPELWYELGDHLFHFGWLVGRPDSHVRSAAAFRRASELDPRNADAIQHLAQLTAREGDVEALRDAVGRYLLRDSTGGTADFLRWRLAVALGDEPTLRALRARFDSTSTAALRWIAVTSQDEGIAAADARLAVEIRAARLGTRDERLERLLGRHALALNQGRPSEALAATREIADVQTLPREHLRLRVLGALYGDGDRGAAARVVEALEAAAQARGASGPAERRARHEDACVAAQWRAATGDAAAAESLAARLRGGVAAGDTTVAGTRRHVCVLVIEAQLAAAGTRPDAAAALERLDSLMLTGPFTGATDHGTLDYGNLVVARLREAAGDLPGALAAVRRRVYFHGWHPFAATYFREEGRLAERVGKREVAIRAYRRYLELRYDAEPALATDAAWVRAALARLENL
jgi:DNA-binding SARP family transcriptional activator